MKGSLKNIFRLPNVFLPVFLVVFLSAVLILLCNSVYTSCVSAEETLNENTEISMELVLKERLARVETEDGGYKIVDLNNKLLDGQVLELLRAEPRISELHYVCNPYFVPAGLLCTEAEYAGMQAAMAEGGSFSRNTQLGVHEVGVAGCTREELIPETLGVAKEDLSVTYLSKSALKDGVLLPKKLYDGLGRPERFLVGWYKTEGYGLQLDADLPDYMLSHFEDLKKKPEPPLLSVPVCGYYTRRDDPKAAAVIVADVAYWQSIYRAREYYAIGEQGQSFSAEGDAFSRVGLLRIGMTTPYPGEVSSIMGGLMDAGLDGDSYLITASDYEYKFVLAQIESLENFSGVLFYAAALFGSFLLAVFLTYAVRKRQKESYILRALGYGERGITLSFTLEFGLVMLAALACGIGAASLWGNGICSFISQKAMESVGSAVENLSPVAQSMANSEDLREQLENAVRRYTETDLSLSYGVSYGTYGVLLAAVWAFSAYLYGLARRITKRNMMDKED